MTAQYWVARYVEDLFRNEPRNVGVIVALEGDIRARFIGERDDGILDRRKLGAFSHPSVYGQWRDFWRDELSAGNLASVIKSSTANYFVSAGGEVTDTGADSAEDVCQFLFSALVGSGGAVEAFQLADEDATDYNLSGEIVELLKRENLLMDQDMLVRHPITRNANVVGRHVTHNPSFSQRNGKLYVFEYIDLSRPQQKHIRERAGWMAYMFSDIKEAEPNSTSYSLLRPAEDGGESIEFARNVLTGESLLVNWSNSAERGAFLEERKRVADAI